MCFGCSDNGRIGWTAFFTMFFVTLTILTAVYYPSTINSIIEAQQPLVEYTPTYQNWIRRPLYLYLNSYIFNWTNVENYTRWETEKPNFVEMGPYVFEEYAYRDDVVYNENETIVAFNQTKVFTFRPELSNGSLSDVIYTVNPVAASLAYMYRQNPNIAIRTFVITLLNLTSFFVGKTVQEWFWDGFQDRALDVLQDMKQSGTLPESLTQDIPPYERFAFYYERNASSIYDGRFEMYTGKDDLSKRGLLISWNGKETFPGLKGECAKVKGSSCEMWPVNFREDETTIFGYDLCRTLTYKRSGNVEMNGLKGWRWTGDDSVFDNGENYPEAECMCIEEDEEKCPALKPGMTDASQCYFNSPIFISNPHFYQADESYREGIEGMKPNKDLHESYVSVQPETGTTMEIKVKAQLNIFTANSFWLPFFRNFPDMFVPMFWIQETMDITPELVDQVQRVFIAKNVGNWIVGILSGIDVICGVLLVVFVWMKFSKKRKVDSIISERVSEDLGPDHHTIHEKIDQT